MTRRAAASVAGAVAGLALATPFVFTEGSDRKSVPEPTTSAAGYAACPPVMPAAEDGFTLSDRELPNLGGNVLGHWARYASGDGEWIEIGVGVDNLEAYEDLDFTPSGHILAGSRRLTVSTTRALPTRSALHATSWDDRALPKRCQHVTVVARMPLAVFLDRLRAIGISSRS